MQDRLHAHLATAARGNTPAAQQRCKFDAPLLAAGLLTQTGQRYREQKLVCLLVL